MNAMRGFTKRHALAIALLGSLLMFVGWVLALVPTFHHLSDEWPVVAVALIAFGAVLIPPGADLFNRLGQPGEKRGLFPVLIAVVPAALLYIVVVVVLPLATGLRVLAVILELMGMAVFLVAWGSYGNVTRHA